jgi:hypothetical protein
MVLPVPNQGLLAYALKEKFVEADRRERWRIRSEDANLCSWGDLASARLVLEERASLTKVNIHLERTPLFNSQKRGMPHVKARGRESFGKLRATWDASLLSRKVRQFFLKRKRGK